MGTELMSILSNEQLRTELLKCEGLISLEARKEGITMAIRDPKAKGKTRRLSHLLWLVQNSLQLVENKEKEKAILTLGYLQGTLWTMEMGTVDEFEALTGLDKKKD